MLCEGEARAIFSGGVSEPKVLARAILTAGYADFELNLLDLEGALHFEATLSDGKVLESQLVAFCPPLSMEKTSSDLSTTVLKFEAWSHAELLDRIEVAHEARAVLGDAARDAEERANFAETRARQLACAGQLRTQKPATRPDLQRYLRKAIEDQGRIIDDLEKRKNKATNTSLAFLRSSDAYLLRADAEERLYFKKVELFHFEDSDHLRDLEVLERKIDDECLKFLEEENVTFSDDRLRELFEASADVARREIERLENIKFAVLETRSRFLRAVRVNSGDKENSTTPRSLAQQNKGKVAAALRRHLADLNAATTVGDLGVDRAAFPLSLDASLRLPSKALMDFWLEVTCHDNCLRATLVYEDPYVAAVFVDCLAKRERLKVLKNDSHDLVIRIDKFNTQCHVTLKPADLARVAATIDFIRHRYIDRSVSRNAKPIDFLPPSKRDPRFLWWPNETAGPNADDKRRTKKLL